MVDDLASDGPDVLSGPGAANEMPDDVVAAARAGAVQSVSPPAWLNKWVWQSLWKVVAVGLATFVLASMAWRAQSLLRLLGLSLFFAIAMVPAVNYLHAKRGWKRGVAVGAIYAVLLLFMVLMVVVLIPGVSDFAGEVGKNGDKWVAELNSKGQKLIGKDLIGRTKGDDAVVSTADAISGFSKNLGGIASEGLGLIFNVATIALFTFYFAADWPRIQKALLARMPPRRQKVTGWVMDTAIKQTGGYFYSRLLLMLINGGLFFVAMLLVGMPVVYALPMSVFEGFVAEFIPAVGTYIGAAVPILMTLAVQGLGSGLILLVWTLIYQQGENYWLSPKLSAETMSINGGVAFGSALAGGAIAGPMGAFMALPFAALITSIISNSGKTYAVVYASTYGEESSGGDVPGVDGTATSGTGTAEHDTSPGEASPPDDD
ncbi:MAG: AI-2E family transporter [Candidatus Microthrix subdominans]